MPHSPTCACRYYLVVLHIVLTLCHSHQPPSTSLSRYGLRQCLDLLGNRLCLQGPLASMAAPPWLGLRWAEFIAIELAILALGNAGLRNITIPLWSDNEGVVGTFNSGYSC